MSEAFQVFKRLLAKGKGRFDADSAKRYRQYYNGLTDAEKENDHEVSVNAYLKSGMAPKSVRYAEVFRRTFGDLRAYEEAVADGTLSGEAERIRGEMVFTHLAEVMNEIEKKTVCIIVDKEL
ncbi:hypothetical protein N7471_010795 [Penicillium samsonianum]|uniref:uncharacterized protein n=1 Tax=Penicillium samsonianum TaxID=1882272 RepID=UPI002548F9D1|nr:uncharacterized protein N7471_010795 [Penicillium samsonianum]KAJ6126302.1 hypothetical protein N7471_010795 [Penicillium samsonianum]